MKLKYCHRCVAMVTSKFSNGTYTLILGVNETGQGWDILDVHKVSSRLPVADSKHKVSSGLPVAGCQFSCRLPIQNIKLVVGCRLPVADSVAGCRFSCRFKTNYIQAKVDSCRFSCRLAIQLPIRNRQYKFNESATGN